MSDATGQPTSAPAPEQRAAEAVQDDPGVRRAERLISTLLRVGVWGSLLLVAIGTVADFVVGNDGTGPHRGASAADLHRLTGAGGTFPRSIDWLLAGLRRFDGTALIVLGLLLLIATPVMRVAVSILVFARQRDRVFVAVTTAVLALLILSFVLGRVAD